MGSENDTPREVVDGLGGADMQRTLAALRPPPPLTPAVGWSGRELFEQFVPLDTDEAAAATLDDVRDLCVSLAHQGVRSVPGYDPRAADYAEACGRLRQLVTLAATTRPQQAAAATGGGQQQQSGRAPDGTATALETGSAADKKREACVPMARLYPLQRSEYVAAEARAAAAPAVRALSPVAAVARLVSHPEPAGSAAFAYIFSSATTEDKASGSIAISIKVARGALVAELRSARLRGMGGQLERNVTEDHKEELKVYFESLIYGRVDMKTLIRLYAWVMPDQDHGTLQNTLGAGRPGDPTARLDFQRAMPLAFKDMSRVWGGAAGCDLGPDGEFGLRAIFDAVTLDTDMPRIHVIFNDIFNGFFLAFARCRAVDGHNYTLEELSDAAPHRSMVGAYLRPNLVNIVAAYKFHTVGPVRRDQKEDERVEMKVDARLEKKLGAAAGAASSAQLAAVQTQMLGLQRDINALKRGPPPPPPAGGPPAGGPPLSKQPRQPGPQLGPLVPPAGGPTVPGSPGATSGAPSIPMPKDPGDFAAVVKDPVKLVERYEWALHKAGKPASCGWISLFDACRLGAAPPSGKRPCPRCAAGLTDPDKDAFMRVMSSGMDPARMAELAAVKAKRGWA